MRLDALILRPPLLAGFLLVAMAFGSIEPAVSVESPDEGPRGMLLRLEFNEDGVRPVSVQPVPFAPRERDVRPIRLGAKAWRKLRPGATQRVIVFHDADGRVIRAFAISKKPRVHFERKSVHGLRGIVGSTVRDIRTIHLPRVGRAAFVSVLEVEVADPRRVPDPAQSYGAFRSGEGPDGEQLLGIRALGAFQAPFGTTPLVPPPIGPGFEIPEIFEFPDPLEMPFAVGTPQEFTFEIGLPATPPFNPHTRWPIHIGGRPDTTFNMVILGDGFAAADTVVYNQLARGLAAQILSSAPFSALQNKISIFAITTESPESGITDCSRYMEILNDPTDSRTEDDFPLPGHFPVRTFFGVKGYYPDPTYPGATYAGYCGIEEPSHVVSAAAPFFRDGAECHLYIVIANCPASGGAAWVDERIVVVTRGRTDPYAASWAAPDDPFFIGMHEMGHVIAGLAEEYITCLAWMDYQTESYPNLVYQDDVDDAWWKRIARPRALNGTQLKVRHYNTASPPIAACSGAHNSGDTAIEAQFDTLGLYWGAQFLDVEMDTMECIDATGWPTYDGWGDPRSEKFYRPLGICRMRTERSPFCPACADTIASIIKDPYPAAVVVP